MSDKVILSTDTDLFDSCEGLFIGFKGLRCLNVPYKIRVDLSVTPVINAPRNVPAASRDKLKKTLQVDRPK